MSAVSKQFVELFNQALNYRSRQEAAATAAAPLARAARPAGPRPGPGQGAGRADRQAEAGQQGDRGPDRGTEGPTSRRRLHAARSPGQAAGADSDPGHAPRRAQDLVDLFGAGGRNEDSPDRRDTRAISASTPPSPRLSAFSTKTVYFTLTTRIRDQKTRESTPNTAVLCSAGGRAWRHSRRV